MEKEWWYVDGDATAGPFSLEEMQGLIAQGKLTNAHLVWKAGEADWVAMGETELRIVPRVTSPYAPEPKQWWYAIAANRQGPVSFDAIKGLVEDGTLQAHHLVWSQGCALWTPASEVESLVALLVKARQLPPTLPAFSETPMSADPGDAPVASLAALRKSDAHQHVVTSVIADIQSRGSDHHTHDQSAASDAPAMVIAAPHASAETVITAEAAAHAQPSTRLAGPLRRLIARFIDMNLIGLPTGIVVAAVGSLISYKFAYWLMNPGADAALGWLLVPLVLLIEAWLFTRSGTTPGKRLLKIQLTNTSGEALSSGDYRLRLRGLYWRGLGTGFPLIVLFTAARQWWLCHRQNATSYDKDKVVCIAQPLSLPRIAGVISVVMLLVLIQLVMSMAFG